jgi:hypothetical protein
MAILSSLNNILHQTLTSSELSYRGGKKNQREPENTQDEGNPISNVMLLIMSEVGF